MTVTCPILKNISKGCLQSLILREQFPEVVLQVTLKAPLGFEPRVMGCDPCALPLGYGAEIKMAGIMPSDYLDVARLSVFLT